jgi:hypothetical protein
VSSAQRKLAKAALKAYLRGQLGEPFIGKGKASTAELLAAYLEQQGVMTQQQLRQCQAQLDYIAAGVEALMAPKEAALVSEAEAYLARAAAHG